MVTDIHYCEECGDREAEVTLSGPGGQVTYLCTSPECMMSAGICPNCRVDLEVTHTDTGEHLYSCPSCDFKQTYEDLGQA